MNYLKNKGKTTVRLTDAMEKWVMALGCYGKGKQGRERKAGWLWETGPK
jgi:hypothetical protein